LDIYLPVKTAFKFGAAVLLLYICTLAPDLVWQDQGDYQYQSALMNLSRPGDVVRVHPLYIVVSHIIGRVTPLSWAYAANLTSAICAAIAAMNLFLIIAMLTDRQFTAFLGAGVYSFAHTPWFTGVQAQTYAMAMALFTGLLLAALVYSRGGKRTHLAAFGLLAGLGLSTHLMTQVGFAVIMVWLFIRLCRGRLKVADFAVVCLCWVLGGLLMWIVMAIEYQRTGDLAGTLSSAILGRWGSAVFNFERFIMLFKRSIMFFVLNFPTPLVLLAAAGIAMSFKKCDSLTNRLLAALTAIYALFAVRYDVRNQNHFFLPMYALVCVYIGLGYGFLFDAGRRKAAVICGLLLFAIPAMYPVMAYAARSRNLNLGTNRHIPYRDVYTYYLVPWQHDQLGPRRMASEVLDKLPDDAVLYADTTVSPPIEYMMYIEGVRPDITLMLSLTEVPEFKDKVRIFTICDVPGYCPKWAKPENFKPFAISDSEHIFEIIQ